MNNVIHILRQPLPNQPILLADALRPYPNHVARFNAEHGVILLLPRQPANQNFPEAA